MVLAGIVFLIWSEATKKPRILIESFPSGANVNIDGKPQGVSPFYINIQPGERRIILTKKGYEDAEHIEQITRQNQPALSYNLVVLPSNQMAVSGLESKLEKLTETITQLESSTASLKKTAPTELEGYVNQIANLRGELNELRKTILADPKEKLTCLLYTSDAADE